MWKHICASLALAALTLLPAAADATQLYIREYKGIPTIGLTYGQIAPEPGTDQTPVNFGSGAASSAAFASSTHVVRLVCDVACSILFGSAPTATNQNALLPGGVVEYFAVVPGQVVSVHSNP